MIDMEKPLSLYTNEELLDFLGITASEDEVFRNYNITKEEKRKHLLEQAQEIHIVYAQHH